MAKGSVPKCLFLPIFDQAEFPYWMSYDPEMSYEPRWQFPTSWLKRASLTQTVGRDSKERLPFFQTSLILALYPGFVPTCCWTCTAPQPQGMGTDTDEMRNIDFVTEILEYPAKDAMTSVKAFVSGAVYAIYIKKLLTKSISHAVKCLSGKQKMWMWIPYGQGTKTHPGVWVLQPTYGKWATLLWLYLKGPWGISLYQVH